jgi:hypothetical protein
MPIAYFHPHLFSRLTGQTRRCFECWQHLIRYQLFEAIIRDRARRSKTHISIT